MRYRDFGKLGWRVSEVGFGAWAVGGGWGPQSDGDSVKAIHRAIDLGCNFIDTAQGYGKGHSERIIARALKEAGSTTKVYVATKVPPAPGTWPPSPYDRIEERFPQRYLKERVEQSLAALSVDCIDLLQIHTWTRAWNRNPAVLEELRELKKAGKVAAIGVSTPEQDQNAVIDLMRDGWVDAIQVVYNIFEQEPQAELFQVALESAVGVIIRVALDESALAGKLTPATLFADGDVRARFFAGDRLQRTTARVDDIRNVVGDEEPSLAAAALKFALKPKAVSTVIPGIRSVEQAELNMLVGSSSPMSDELERKLRDHLWRRGFWYDGK